MSKMRVVQVPGPNGPFELVEREIPEPGAGEVRVRVEACGICHSDSFTKEGLWPGIEYPRVPGHEVAGVVDAIGTGVAGWTEGLQLMYEGEKTRFWIPESIAYKGKSAPYGMLVFDVELIKIQ